MTPFTGIPEAAFEFYAELEHNNARLVAGTQIHLRLRGQGTPDRAAGGAGAGVRRSQLFRPNRDIRFSADNPLQTAQGAVAAVAEAWASTSARRRRPAHRRRIPYSTPAQLARFRSAVDAPSSGGVLQRIVAQVEALGFAVEGETLKTVPRGFAKDHPRADLLKHKSLAAGMHVGRPDWISTPDAAWEVARRWEELRPLVEWISRYAAP